MLSVFEKQPNYLDNTIRICYFARKCMMSTVATKTSVDKSQHSLAKCSSTRERIMANTMSVDEYFDELIDQVREDYANL